MQRNYFSILFYIRKTRLLKNGETDTPKTLLEIFREHNQKYRDLMGKEFAKGTVLRYERTVTYLEEFLQAKYNLNNIPIKNVTNSFVLEFEHYVKITKNCAQNAAIKYLKNLKKVTRLALANKWLDEDPFYGIRFHQTQTNRDFLTEEELNTIINRNFGIPRLEIVRDIFVFCSFTGLAFTDVKHLTPDHITYTPDSGYWIKKAREKTNNLCNVPLLEIPLRIIEKYKNHPGCLAKGVVLPVPSNQKMNSYLKEIADVCGINKTLSTHIARHTFACVAIANRVSMESIAKMLGHSDIKTTKIYARLMDKSVAEEMNAMRRKFDNQATRRII